MMIPGTDEQECLPNGSCLRELNQLVFGGDYQVLKPVCLDIISETCLPVLTVPPSDTCDKKCDTRKTQSAVRKTRSTQVVKPGIQCRRQLHIRGTSKAGDRRLHLIF